MNPETNQFTHLLRGVDPSGSGDKIVLTLHFDEEGFLWFGTFGDGIARYDPNQDQATHFRHDENHPETLSNNMVFTIYGDPNGVLWIGTSGGGFNRFDPNTQSFRRFGKEQGLPNDVVYGILADDEGTLWMSTNKGLAQFDPATETIRTYTFKDGLQDNEFNAGAYFKGQSGELFFGGTNGFTSFDPSRITLDTTPPKMAITDFYLFGQSLTHNASDNRSPLRKPITETTDLMLTHEEQVFSFEFALLDFSDSPKNHYTYRLEGFDKKWISTDASRRTATYTKLSPGDYTFHVRGRNPDGIWSEESRSIDIKILPPPWLTWWAKSLYVVAFTLLVWGVANLISYRKKLRFERLSKQHLDKMVARRTIALEEKQQQLLTQSEQLAHQTERLREMDNLKTRFFTNISHELRTPLTLTLGPIDEMLADPSQSEASKAKLALMKRNAKQLKGLIDELLDISKLEAGQVRLNLEKTELVSFCKAQTDNFTPWAERAAIKMGFQSQHNQWHCHVDRGKLQKILYNLIANAIKHTDSGGKVFVSLSEEKTGWVQIIVTDTGAGIAPEQLPRIFERFYQGVESSKGMTGFGLGLSLAHDLVELHKGRIEVSSELGFGSTFTVVLPNLQSGETQETRELVLPEIEDHSVPETASIPHPNPDVHTQPTILIIDDHPEMRAYLHGILHPHYSVLLATQGREGIQMAEDAMPSLILSDVMMPEIDGLELCRQLKQNPKTNHIPVVLLTAKASEQNITEGLTTGADDYLVKPFNVDELHARIANLIQSRRTLQDRFRQELLLKPSNLTVPAAEKVFLSKVSEVINQNLYDPRFGVLELAVELGLSERSLHHKVKAATAKGPGDLLRRFRMERAAQLLSQKAGNISEIASLVGYRDAQYFSKVFRKAYGVTPSEYLKADDP